MSPEHKLNGSFLLFWDQFVEKEDGMSTYKPSFKELGD